MAVNIGEKHKRVEVCSSGEEQTPDSEAKPPALAMPKFSGDPLIGTIVDGRFQIEELLGVGGTSVVYKARQLCVNRFVAIKTLKFLVDDRPALGERFQREISSLIALSHPNIVTIYDCVIDADDQPFIVMDYLRGRSLDRLLQEEGRLSLDRFLTVILQVFSAVEHAHKKGIVHRDLKPGNIVLVDDEMNFVKVVDFGLAKLAEESRRITRSGELWGSPPYMSPEQCIGERVDERSDIYSLGALMFEMLAGREPFTAGSVYELIQKHLLASPPSINNCNSEISIPLQLEKVVLKALSKNPDNRYQSIGDLKIAVLDACSADVNRDSGSRIEAIATHTGSSDDLLTYVKAMAPYVMCSSLRPVESSRAGACQLDSGVRIDDTVCDADRPELSGFTLAGFSLRTGFWSSIGLFFVSLVAACSYVVGTVDGIRATAENRIGASARSPERGQGADAHWLQRSLPPDQALQSKVHSIHMSLKESTVRPKSLIPNSPERFESRQAKPARQSRAFVKQSQASIASQKRQPSVSQSRDPWDALDGLRSSR